jgi:nuclear-control-of-ATPase protein 2
LYPSLSSQGTETGPSANERASQVCRIDARLDRALGRSVQTPATTSESADTLKAFSQSTSLNTQALPRVRELQAHIKRLSTTAEPLAGVGTIVWTLQASELSSSCPTCSGSWEDAQHSYEHELEWMLLSKATVQAYGQVLDTILNETIALQDHAWYWEDVVSSRRELGIYSIQTSPLRIWNWSTAFAKDLLSRRGAFSDGWGRFYGLIRDTVRDRSVLDIQKQVTSPIARIRDEVVQKQNDLRLLRDINSNALGVLLGEGLSQVEEAAQNLFVQGDESPTGQWDKLPKSIALLETVLYRVSDPLIDIENFESQISSSVAQDEWSSGVHLNSTGDISPGEAAARLQKILTVGLETYSTSFHEKLARCGRPSRLVRYWLPASVTILASSTILKLVLSRKETIISGIRDFGETVLDFWRNWVVEPARKVVGTIRHDEGSEIALMSKASLQGDRDNLERMAVDFVADNASASLSDAQIQEIRDMIREGDLTPVLKIYEQDVKNPLLGAIRGRLIRALLIELKKTKVDVEIAMGGIDSMLKSQELLFG